MNVSAIPKRTMALLLATVLLCAAMLPLVRVQKASAYGLLTNRAIELSSSKQNDTGVTYLVSFNLVAASTIKSIAVDFCSTTPIIGDTCTVPTAFTVGGSPTVANFSIGGNSQAGWTYASLNSGRTLTITKAAGYTPAGAGEAVTFEITGVHNPNTTNTSFYGRLLTFPNNAGSDSAANYTDTVPGTPTDAGGVAMSTTNQITITSKVQERLAFCVYTGANCAAGGNAVTLGDTNGVLDPAGPYVDKTTKYDVSTNASSGVAIRIKGDTLKAGSYDVTAIGGTAVVSSAGTEQFGFCSYQSTGSGLTPVTLYDGTGGTGGGACSGTSQSAGTGTTGGVGTSKFAFDTTNTNTTYGQVFANKTAGNTSTGVIAFLGNVANTTEASIYTTTLTFVATGTY